MNTRAVGVGAVVGDRGAVIAVVRRSRGGRLRLTGVAELSWPGTGGEPSARVLERTRRRLGLKRSHPVQLVPTRSAAAPARLLAGATALLVGAGLTRHAVIDPDRAATRRRGADLAIDPRVVPLAASPEAALAAGAALTALDDDRTDLPLPGTMASTVADVDPPGIDQAQLLGWAVEPRAATGANHR